MFHTEAINQNAEEEDRKRMSEIQVNKGGVRTPVMFYSQDLIDQTKALGAQALELQCSSGLKAKKRKKKCEKWKQRSDQGTAKMLHQLIPSHEMTTLGKFVLSLNLPGGTQAKLPLQTTNDGDFNTIGLQLGKEITIHSC